MQIRVVSVVLAAASLLLMGSGQRSDALMLSFHLETDQADYPKFARAVKMGNPARQYFFKLIPILTDRDIEWFYPFVAEDGVTYGCAFKLDQRGSQELRSVSLIPENHGKLLAGYVHPVRRGQVPVQSFVIIDRPVSDGVVVIWSGLNNDHLALFAKRFPNVKEFTGR